FRNLLVQNFLHSVRAGGRSASQFGGQGIARLTCAGSFLGHERRLAKCGGGVNLWKWTCSSQRLPPVSFQEIPIKMPARKTSAPPRATCKMADTSGVSMNRWRIHE